MVLNEIVRVDQKTVSLLFEEGGLRVKQFTVPIRVLLHFIYGELMESKAVLIPEIVLPNGCKVLAASLDEIGACVRVSVHHPSFPLLPEGMELPRVNAEVKWNLVNLQTEERKDLLDRRYAAVQKLRDRAATHPDFVDDDWIELQNLMW